MAEIRIELTGPDKKRKDIRGLRRRPTDLQELNPATGRWKEREFPEPAPVLPPDQAQVKG